MSDLRRAGLLWAGDSTLLGASTSFLAVFDERSQEVDSSPERFVLMKSPDMIEWYASRFAQAPPRSVLEVGIFKGGSVAFFEELWHPRRLVAVDIDARPVVALAEYIRRIDAAERVRAVYAVDQSDQQAMRGVLAQHFEGEPIDLIVDDGCHFLYETRALFSTTFPYLRPGGTYIIEDWAWAHWPGSWQQDGGPWRDKPALTSIALELAMLAASRGDLVKSVEVTSAFIVVRKGTSAVVPEDFDLASSYLTADRTFLEAGFPPVRPGARADVSMSDGTFDAARVAQLEQQLRAMRQSTSWRITGPLRRLGDALRRRGLR